MTSVQAQVTLPPVVVSKIRLPAVRMLRIVSSF